MNRILESPLIGKVVAITISPPPRQGDYNDLHYINYMPVIWRWLRRCARRYIMYPEFSDIDCRLHYHGWAYIDDNIAYIKGLPRIQQIGFVMLKPLKTHRDRLSWMVYCSKHQADLSAFTPPALPIMPKRLNNRKRKQENKITALMNFLATHAK